MSERIQAHILKQTAPPGVMLVYASEDDETPVAVIRDDGAEVTEYGAGLDFIIQDGKLLGPPGHTSVVWAASSGRRMLGYVGMSDTPT